MDLLRALVERVRQLLWRSGADARTDEELRFHVEMETEKNVRAGMSAAEARRRALADFGGFERHRLALRDARRLVVLEDGWRDLHYAVRGFRRNVLWTLSAVLIVGGGIGASVTVFSLVHALLLRPLPFAEPERLVWISNGESGDLSGRTVQGAHLETLATGSGTLAAVAGYSAFYGAGDHHLLSADEPERVTVVPVTGAFFPLLGVEPLLGRAFTAEESAPGGPRSVLLAHAFWARRLGSDPGVVGRTLTLDGQPLTVTGVLPAGFDFGSLFAPGTRVDMFTPFPIGPATNRRGNTLAVVGRLAPGATVAQAEREAAARVARAAAAGADYNAFEPRVRPLREQVSGSLRPAMLLLAGAVALVMLVVCANLSNLLLTRAAARGPELALRAALGAGRSRLIRQLLTESVLLSSAGAALGVLLAAAGTQLLAHDSVLDLPLLDQVRLDWTVLGFAAATAVLTGLVFGLAPALRASAAGISASPVDTGLRATAGRRHTRLHRAIVVTQVSLACTLLVTAGLLLRSFEQVLDVDPGFRAEGAVAVRIDPLGAFDSPEERSAWYAEARALAARAPGVDEAGLGDVLPFGFNRTWSVGAVGRAYEPGERPAAFVRVVSEGYLAAMGVALRRGRDFSARDDVSGSPVVIINETLADALWPGENPVGRPARIGGSPDREVVGVVGGTRHQALELAPGPELYIPLAQTGDFGAVYLVARGGSPPDVLTAAVRAALRPLDATLPLGEVRVLEDLVDGSVSARRVVAALVGGFAAFALLLASLGIYAVVAFGVSRRRREIGVRVALGASAPALEWRILTETLALAAPGILLGLVPAWVAARALRSQLYSVSPTDPVAFLAAVALLVGVAALAGYVPARRAARLSPTEALRAE